MVKNRFQTEKGVVSKRIFNPKKAAFDKFLTFLCKHDTILGTSVLGKLMIVLYMM